MGGVTQEIILFGTLWSLPLIIRNIYIKLRIYHHLVTLVSIFVNKLNALLKKLESINLWPLCLMVEQMLKKQEKWFMIIFHSYWIFDVLLIAWTWSQKILWHIICQKKIINYCKVLTRFFKTSHRPGELLNQLIEEKGIEGGGLKTLVKTRWISTYECLASVLRLKPCFEEVVNIFFFKKIFIRNN